MLPTFTFEPTIKNIDFAEKVCDLYSDYDLKLITEEEFENELKKLGVSL